MVDEISSVIDADNHIYERPEALTAHLPERYRRAARFLTADGRQHLVIQNRIADFIPNPTFEVVAAPGAFVPYFAADNPEGLTLRELAGAPIKPLAAFCDDPASRVALMDAQRVEKAIVYPTLAGAVDAAIRGEPELNHALVHAINEWILDTWTFDYRDRVFVTPVVCMSIVDDAIKELDWAVEHGARAVLVLPFPPEGPRGCRSFGLPEFDPFWTRVQELNVAICMHSGEARVVEEYVNAWEPRNLTTNFFTQSPFRSVTAGHRAIEDALASMICHGTLSRFPELRIASVEGGAEWVAYLLHRLNTSYGQAPKAYAEPPLEVFRRNVFIHPFWEDDIGHLIEHVGVERVLFGSDYPHPEGLAEPREFEALLTDLSPQDRQKIMHDNAAELLAIG